MNKNAVSLLVANLANLTQLGKGFSKIASVWPTRFITLLTILFIAVVAYWRIQHQFPELLDFYNAYYPAGRLILEHPEQLYGSAKLSIYGFVNLPILAYLFTPFSLLDEYQSSILFTLLGVFSIFAIGLVLIKLADLQRWKKLCFIALLIISSPLYNSIWYGNSTHFVFLLVLGSFLSFHRQKDIWSGALLAIAGLIKIPLLFPIIYFLLKRRWQIVISFFATLFAIVGLSILVCGLSLNLVWFKECILAFSGQVFAAYNVQSVDAFLIRLLTDTPIDAAQYVEGNWLFKLLRYGIFSLLIGGTLLACWRSRHITSTQVENLEFSSFLCLALLISPISWTHYYLFLLLPIALYLGGQLSIPSGWRWSALMTLSILLVIAPNVRNIPTAHPVIVALTRHILVSHYFWGGVLLLGVLLTSLLGQTRMKQSAVSDISK
ncbi:MAG: glycosyltransferase family 87 protein [Aulosira sp. DedVER01a]|nr:glycosyltransferase family 87 protein [Aulosira sp. DedVER01a]